MSDAFSKTPRYLLDLKRDGSLSSSAIQTFVALNSFRNNKTGECFPKAETVADRVGQSKRTVMRHLEQLEGVGAITRHPTFHPLHGCQVATRYTLNMTQAERQKCHTARANDKEKQGDKKRLAKGVETVTPNNKTKKELDTYKGAVAPNMPLSTEDREALGNIHQSYRDILMLVGKIAECGGGGVGAFWYDLQPYEPTDAELEATTWLAYDHLKEAEGRGTTPLLSAWRRGNRA